MKLFLTGGTGFVGAHFVEQALAAGHDVTAQRRTGSRPRRALATEPRWVDGALDADWRAELESTDVLVHLAAHSANPPYDTLPECLRHNVLAPLALAEQARAAGVKRFLVAGSCFEYGEVDSGEAGLAPDAPLAPNNAYATSKATASQAFLGFAREHRLQLRLLRIFHVYGEGEPATRLWPTLREAARRGDDFPMSAGAQVRDFVPVETVARRFVDALDFTGVPPGEPWQEQVGSGQASTLLDFARHWWAHWGATGQLKPGEKPYRPGEIMRLVPREPHGHTLGRQP